MRRIMALALCAWLWAVLAARAGSNSASEGTAPGDFLNLAAGARAAGMGGAYSAVADDATALYWNPAALTQIKGGDVALMHAPLYADSFFDYGAYGRNLGGKGAYGLGLQYFSAGNIALTENDQAIGTYHPYDFAASAGYAYAFMETGIAFLDGFAFGLAAKYIRSQILTAASAKALDWGVLSPTYADGRLRLALTMSNLGSGIKFDQAVEALPLVMRAGGSYKVMEGWLMSLDADFPQKSGPYGAIGTEYARPVAGAWRLAMRAGFSSQTANAGSALSGASMGLGLGNGQLAFDYAFMPVASMGFSQRISLGFKWGDSPRRREVRPAAVERKWLGAADAAPSHLKAAEHFIGLGAMEEAKDELAQADQTMGLQDSERIRYYQLSGEVSFAQKKVSGAKVLYVKGLNLSKALKIRSFYTVEAYVGLGKCLLAEGNKSAAAKAFQKAYELDSSPENLLLLEGEGD